MNDDLDERELDAPPSAAALYRCRGEDVNEWRPVQTGDVYEGVEVPGLDDGPGLVIVMNHPCSMRRNGVDLIDRLLVARVTDYQFVPPQAWPKSHVRVMPLPELYGDPDGHFAARLDQFGLVPSTITETQKRVACLQPLGINLLQQRFIFSVARFVVDTKKLQRTCAVPFEEIDLLEEWMDEWAEAGQSMDQAGHAFHDWVRAKDELGATRQDRLADEQQRPSVRQDMRDHLESLG